jgi:hypothetical protein
MMGTSLLTPKQFYVRISPRIAVGVSLTSVSNERHFTLDAQTVLRQYLRSHCTRMSKICHIAQPAHALHAVKFRLKLVSNKGHFTHEAERVFRTYHTRHCSWVTKICHIALLAHALRVEQVRLKSVSNEGDFALEAETFSTVSPLALNWGD